MKTISKFRIALCTFLFIFIYSTIQSQTVTDFDGNIYQTVNIGNQTWMAENLKTRHYSNGDSINDGRLFTFYPTDVRMEGSNSTKYYFSYDNDSSNVPIHGLLYNWYAAVNGNLGSHENPSGIQGVCPSGWHIPSESEWNILREFVGENSRKKLENGGNTGFNGLYSGFRSASEIRFNSLGRMGAFISSTDFSDSPGFCILYELFIEQDELKWHGHFKTCGYSVRCLKDSQTTSVNHIINNSKFTLYPNPVNDILTIQTSTITQYSIEITSLNGQLIYSTKMEGTSHQIDLSSFQKGVYFISIRSKDIVATRKIIKL